MRFGAMTMPSDVITCSGIVKQTYEEEGKKYAVLALIAEKGPDKVVGSGEADFTILIQRSVNE